MNEYDSERILALLGGEGYEGTDDPEEADLIVLNTCSVRAKPEQKAYSYLGRLRRLKRTKPDLLVAMGGCVAQKEGKTLMERIPHLDIVFGTHRIEELPNLIKMAGRGGTRICRTDFDKKSIPLSLRSPQNLYPKVNAHVTIMRGCDNYCTFCAVPYVRGREKSRRPDEIIEEIRNLVDKGTKEVTLLGQNVNSYGKGLEPPIDFPELLSRVEEIDGLSRIRFTTSHPKDLSHDLIECFGNLRKLCEHLHLPVQSGSSRILKKMGRDYTKDEYLEKVRRLREVVPEIALSSDIMVGFPGESEADFDESLDLLQKVRFHSLYSFKYSDRAMARAASFGQKVAEEVKERRLAILQDLQEKITTERNREYVGSTQEVLVEGVSRKASSVNLKGRSRTNAICHFEGDHGLTGNLVDVKIEKAFKNSLLARMTKEV
jgi:tRNA-2-methylthio-N6-dimethylallyladenosine synthase